MRGQLYTEEEIGKIKEWYEAGISIAKMAKALGRGYPSVRGRVGRMHHKEGFKDKRPDNGDYKQRKCLRCGEMFISSWKGNRICKSHKEQSDGFDTR